MIVTIRSSHSVEECKFCHLDNTSFAKRSEHQQKLLLFDNSRTTSSRRKSTGGRTDATPCSIHMPCIPCTLERGTCTLVSFFSIFAKVFFVLGQSPMRMHNRSSSHPVEHRILPFATEMSPTAKSDPNITKNIFASVNRMRQLCGRSVYIVSRRSADTTLG